MDYTAGKDFLLTEFRRLGYEGALKGKKHSREFTLVTLGNGTVLLAVFPGVKACVKGRRGVVYDYRVDIIKGDVRTTLSHVNIVVDVYSKCYRQRELIPDFRKFLGNLAAKGLEEPYIGTRLANDIVPGEPPLSDWLDCVQGVHDKLGKTFNRDGNQWDLTLDELSSSMFWIAIQEELNYPREEGYEGRRMPFARYLEATYWVDKGMNLGDLVHRVLAHDRPTNVPGIDYSVIDKAVNW